MFTCIDACPLGLTDVGGPVCQDGGCGLHDDLVWRLYLSQAFSVLPWVKDYMGGVVGGGGGGRLY